MKWLCLGGSFDPIHLGHLICARVAAAQIGADAVRILTAAVNPHKAGTANVTASDSRISMCRLATAGLSDVVVDDLETRRPPPSYTIDTVHELRRMLPTGDTFAWLVGTDHLPRLSTWHRFEELIELVEIVAMQRAGHATPDRDIPEAVRTLAARVVAVPQIEISSTEIRRRVRAGLPIDGMVHPAVGRHIAETGLYRDRVDVPSRPSKAPI